MLQIRGDSNGGPHTIASTYAVRQRVFCFPHAGGGRSLFHGWSRELPPGVDAIPVALPGREHRCAEPPCRRLAELVRTLARELADLFDRPFAFFGHSLGALVAFELTRCLRREGRRGPHRLFLSSRRAPQLTDAHPPIHHLPDAAFVSILQQRYDGIPAAVLDDRELMALFLPVLKADIGMIETYVYANEGPLDCPIAAFGGLQDTSVSQAELEAWQNHTAATFTLQRFPGDHFYLKGPTRQPLLRVVGEALLQDGCT